MKIETGKTYLTRDGNKVRIICDDRKGSFPLIGLMIEGSKEKVLTFSSIGRYPSTNGERNLDLIKEYDPWLDVDPR